MLANRKNKTLPSTSNSVLLIYFQYSYILIITKNKPRKNNWKTFTMKAVYEPKGNSTKLAKRVNIKTYFRYLAILAVVHKYRFFIYFSTDR